MCGPKSRAARHGSDPPTRVPHPRDAFQGLSVFVVVRLGGMSALKADMVGASEGMAAKEPAMPPPRDASAILLYFVVD